MEVWGCDIAYTKLRRLYKKHPDGHRQITLTLDSLYAEKLGALADRQRVPEDARARSLLTTALDEADPDPRRVADILDGIPGRLEPDRGGSQAGEGIPLDEL